MDSSTTPNTTNHARFSFLQAFLVVLLILTIAGGIASLIFLRRLELLIAERERLPKTVGACTTPTRALQAEAGVLSGIDFAYPCGWHVVENALVRDTGRRGIVSDYLYVNPDPVSFAPRDVEPSRIIIRIDEQNQFKKFPRLMSLAQYIKKAKKQFVTHATTTLAPNTNGVTFTKIDGTQKIFDHDVPVVVYFTEFYDKTQPNRRAVMEIWSGNPKWEDGSVERALELLVQTMKQI